VTEEADQALGEVAVVGQGPEREAVARDNQRAAAPQAVDRGVALQPAVDRQGHDRVAVGEGGADDRHREALVAVGLQQQLLAGDLVA
jgi:hypothetical protein